MSYNNKYIRKIRSGDYYLGKFVDLVSDDTLLSPSDGAIYIIKNGINGFNGKDNNVAIFDSYNETYIFINPIEGMQGFCNANKKEYIYRNNNWEAKETLSIGDMEKDIYDTNNDGVVDKAESITDGNDIFTTIDIKSSIDNSHEHNNKDIIDKFSEDVDGGLLYNDSPVEGNSGDTNIQSDWEQTDSSQDDFIKNKPNIPTSTSDLTNDSDFVVDADYIHTDNNYTNEDKEKLSNLNVINSTDDLIEGDNNKYATGDEFDIIDNDLDDISDGSTYKKITQDEKEKIHNQNTDIGTDNNSFSIGDGTNSDKAIIANLGLENNPSLKYNSTENKWQYSNDGLNWNNVNDGDGSGDTEENLTAQDISVEDINDNFTSNDVEGVLDELFTFVSDGKDLIATAITDKGIDAEGSETFDQLYSKILSLASNRTQVKLNIDSSEVKKIDLPHSIQTTELLTTVFKYSPNDTETALYHCEFDNTDEENFIFNSSITFDGSMGMDDQIDYIPATIVTLDDDIIYESDVMDVNNFLRLYNVEFNDETPEYIITSIPEPTIVEPVSDIDISGIEKMTNITLNSNIEGQGVLKILISFDEGSSYQSWSDGEWVNVNISNLNDVGNYGMSTETINELEETEIEQLRNKSHSLRFAYYLEKNEIDDVVETDSISVDVIMLGEDVLATTDEVEIYLNEDKNQINYDFKISGTFTINYLNFN